MNDPNAPSFDSIGDLVLYNTHQLVAFNKPVNLPVQPDTSGTTSLLEMGSAYCGSTLLLLHRLDRPTSGLVLFARKKSAQTSLNRQFSERQVRKFYLAVVAEKPPQEEGTLVHYLRPNRKGHRNRTAVLEEPAGGAKRAELHYRYVGSSERYHLLLVELVTGRHHQIRAQLGHIGAPVRGDDKYGFKRANPDGGIDLHAWRLSFAHPVTEEEVTLTAPVPDSPVWAAFSEQISAL